MKIGHMLRDALRSLFGRPVTVRYLTEPGEMVPVPERYRGKMVYDREACIGCLLCTKTCPAGAIITTEERKVVFNVDRCIFCGQCVEICVKNAIKHSSDFEIVRLG
ncbi:MAG: F(420)H(2) dehydrogenase subunit I [Candidatus Bathyarchaeota archaeon BA1]|nr:MAG: F(420)H(2) dehydrogenase subunit I [Candidatus Bathyarchaeota archaeon BA1]